MKEWHRTVILAVFLIIALGLIFLARRMPEAVLVT